MPLASTAMYHHLNGTLVHKARDGDHTEAVVDVNGVGFLVRVPLSTLDALPAEGSDVKLFTRLVVREDALTLYGFATEGERALFDALLSVNGVGPQHALGALSGLPLGELLGAIQSGNVGLLKKIKNIGEKTAKRITLELNDKVAAIAAKLPAADAASVAAALPQAGPVADAAKALQTLGLAPAEADRRVAVIVQKLGRHKIEKLAVEKIVFEALRLSG